MISERQIIGKIEVLEDGMIQVREDTIIERDGVEIARSYHRRVLEPSSDTSSVTDSRLKAVVSAVWTQTVVDDFRKKKNAKTTAFVTGLSVAAPQQG